MWYSQGELSLEGALSWPAAYAGGPELISFLINCALSGEIQSKINCTTASEPLSYLSFYLLFYHYYFTE